MRRLPPLLLVLNACTPSSAPIELHAETPDGSRVHVTLTYPAVTCPVSMLPGPCYQYLVRLTPNSSFSPTFVVPPAQPHPELSPVSADSLLARLERQLRKARLKGDSINREGVDQYLQQASRGGFSTLCALRIAVDSATFGRVSLRFYDREGRSLFQRDSQVTGDQALSPGWTDPADEGHMSAARGSGRDASRRGRCRSTGSSRVPRYRPGWNQPAARWTSQPRGTLRDGGRPRVNQV